MAFETNLFAKPEPDVFELKYIEVSFFYKTVYVKFIGIIKLWLIKKKKKKSFKTFLKIIKFLQKLLLT